MNAAVITTGPRVIRPMATASRNCRELSQWCWWTTPSRRNGTIARPEPKMNAPALRKNSPSATSVPAVATPRIVVAVQVEVEVEASSGSGSGATTIGAERPRPRARRSTRARLLRTDIDRGDGDHQHERRKNEGDGDEERAEGAALKVADPHGDLGGERAGHGLAERDAVEEVLAVQPACRSTRSRCM